MNFGLSDTQQHVKDAAREFFSKELPMAEVRSKAYLRLRALDQPGVLAAVGSVFAEEGVSIASMIQKDSVEEGTAELVFTTHHAPEAGLQRARARIAGLEQIKKVAAFYRVF